MKVNIVNKSKHVNPSYSTEHSSGMDLRVELEDKIVVLKPYERKLLKTGIFLEIPDGYEAQIRPRSGLAIKKGLTILNTPGTIDSDYRGEIGVIVFNTSNDEIIIEDGERIAQIVFTKYEKVELVNIEEVNKTLRGQGGFGHTGTN